MGQKMQQITVCRSTGDCTISGFTTWVAVDKRIKKGSIVQFKDPTLKDHEWTVTRVYDQEIEFDTIAKQRDFDNNNYDKHEGLKING